MEQKILKDSSTQKLVMYARLGPSSWPVFGVPAAVEVRIGTPAVAMPSAWDAAAASVESLSAVVEADADEGAGFIVYSPSAQFRRGRHYVAAIGTGRTVALTSAQEGPGEADGTFNRFSVIGGLPQAINAGDTIQAVAIEVSLAAQQTAMVGDGTVLLKADIDGESYEWAESFRIVRRIPRWTLTPPQLLEAYPILHAIRSRLDVDLEGVIRSSWSHRLLPLLERRGVREEDIVSASALEPAHALACVVQVVEVDPAMDRAYVDDVRNAYRSSVETALARKTWFEASQVDEIGTRETTPQRDRYTIRVRR